MRNGNAVPKPRPSFDWDKVIKELLQVPKRGRSYPGFTLDEYKERGRFSSYTEALRSLRKLSEKGLINCIEGTIDDKKCRLFVKPPLGVPSRVPKEA